MDKDLKRSIILDNYQDAYHRERHDNDDSYCKINSRNVSCIDNIDLYIKMNKDVIETISFEPNLLLMDIKSINKKLNPKQRKLEKRVVCLLCFLVKSPNW